MKREETLHLLHNHKAELVKQFGVIRLALFGSTARDTARPGSDVDILIAFDGPATSKRYFGAQFYLEDMIEFSLKVQSYTEGMSQTVFIENTVTYDATLRNLELIGEAATHIPKEIQSANPDIPWRLIIATRNRLIHAYLGIDDDTIWSIIQDDVPA